MNSCQRILAVVAVVFLSATNTFANADWHAWRGPNQSGSVDTGNYPTKWTAEDAEWKVKLPGKGGSTPIVVDDKIVLTTLDGNITE